MTKPTQSAVIVTALDVETRAVLRQLGPWTEQTVEGTVLYIGQFSDWNIAVVEVGTGNIAAAALATRAITHCKAEVALFVGVAGGVKDVALGDVVVASKVYGYERGKDTGSGFLPRPDLQWSAHALEQRARAICKKTDWYRRLDSATRSAEPKLLVAPIAAGEKVVASTRADTAKFIKKQYGDVVAVEMEGRGFLEAVHIHSILGTVVRGISDRLSGKAVSDRLGWQPKAADAAAAVAFEILATLPPKPKADLLPPVNVTPSSGELRTGSDAPSTSPAIARPFLAMPSTLNEGSFFGRGEILARVGLKDVDEVLFSFQSPPDGYLRIVPKAALDSPITNAHLSEIASFAPLLKQPQYGCLTSVNRLGVIAYDPARSYPGGPAPLSWATQLFHNGELWLASNKLIVRERGGRPDWVPIPFIPALSIEQLFFDKALAAVTFAAQHLGLRFPCGIEMGLIGTDDVSLAVNTENIQPMRKSKIICRETLADRSQSTLNAVLLSFFEQIYDATGFARPVSNFCFPPDRPRAESV